MRSLTDSLARGHRIWSGCCVTSMQTQRGAGASPPTKDRSLRCLTGTLPTLRPFDRSTLPRIPETRDRACIAGVRSGARLTEHSRAFLARLRLKRGYCRAPIFAAAGSLPSGGRAWPQHTPTLGRALTSVAPRPAGRRGASRPTLPKFGCRWRLARRARTRTLRLAPQLRNYQGFLIV
jgi:hypothetical protein